MHTAGLLQRVHELVGKESLPRRCMRLVLAGIEDDVVAAGVGTGVDRFCRVRGVLTSVDSHTGGVAAEALLHERACGIGQRFYRAGMELSMDVRRGAGRVSVRLS